MACSSICSFKVFVCVSLMHFCTEMLISLFVHMVLHSILVFQTSCFVDEVPIKSVYGFSNKNLYIACGKFLVKNTLVKKRFVYKTGCSQNNVFCESP